MPTIFESVISSKAYLSAKRQLLEALRSELSTVREPRPASPERKGQLETQVKEVTDARGRELFYPFIGSGAGYGPFVELADGSVKYDLITGIGTNFFGHGNLDLIEAQVDSLCEDIMQGNLQPNKEYGELMQSLLASVSAKTHLRHVWLTSCGATANENALKII